MPSGLSNTLSLLILSLVITSFPLHGRALASPVPSPSLGFSPVVQHAKRAILSDPAYLVPAQIAGIVGSYAFSLIVVALVLLALSKKRREHLRAAEEPDQPRDANRRPGDEQTTGFPPEPSRDAGPSREPGFYYQENPPSYRDGVYRIQPLHPEQPTSTLHGHIRNFSLPSPTALTFEAPRSAEAARFEDPQPEPTSPASYFLPSPTSTTRGPLGQDPDVPQEAVKRDKVMAQTQLEQMYQYVMEQEDAKEQGIEFRAPMVAAQPRDSTMTTSSAKKEKKERNKPASLDLANGEKRESRTSSFLSALKSPGRKKKQVQGISISSPIMTPMSGTFPQYVGEELSSITPRHYAPAMPPPMPANHSQTSFASRRNTKNIAPLLTPPDLAPESTQSIDERMGAIAAADGRDREPYPHQQHGDGDNSEEDDGEGEAHDHVRNLQARHISLALSEADPVSAVSETSTSGLLKRTVLNAPGARTSGLPTSPKPGVNRFPSLPASPKPGQTFARANAPSAVRTGGTLPLRAYENAMLSPTTQSRSVKETVFQRAGPMSPGGMHTARTPMTGNPMPYSPYQPFSPVVPITPSLVTREDRKRMRRLEPKTPTLQMVQSSDEVW